MLYQFQCPLFHFFSYNPCHLFIHRLVVLIGTNAEFMPTIMVSGLKIDKPPPHSVTYNPYVMI